MEKKEWAEPGLIVLVRSKPEEAVLTACKYADTIGGSNSQNSQCAWGGANFPCNILCNALGTS